MKFIFSPFNQAFLNVALEHYLLHEKKEEYLLFYINKPAVVIGKHQNPFAEVNIEYTKQQNIPIVRRFSGGGTVYHDEGNLNIALIRNSLIDFSTFLNPIIKSLEFFGLKVITSPRNDLLFNGYKITGTAAHLFKNRSLLHGTLLYESNIDKINKALDASRNFFIGKFVLSTPAKITTIKSHVLLPFNEFINLFSHELCKNLSISQAYLLTHEEQDKIQSIAESYYKKWDWVFGRTPNFTYKSSLNNLSIEMHVEKGYIYLLISNSLPTVDLSNRNIRFGDSTSLNFFLQLFNLSNINITKEELRRLLFCYL